LALFALHLELSGRRGTAERGLDISYETVRGWVLKFGPMIARRLHRHRPRPSNRWHLDEMVIRIAGKRMCLWRAVDHEDEVLDTLVQRRRDSRVALRLMACMPPFTTPSTLNAISSHGRRARSKSGVRPSASFSR
jgi:hypothetical protein